MSRWSMLDREVRAGREKDRGGDVQWANNRGRRREKDRVLVAVVMEMK